MKPVLHAAALLLACYPAEYAQISLPSASFPVSPSILAPSRDSVNVPAIRGHMWDLFGAITAPGNSSAPLFTKWPLACDAYKGTCANGGGFHLPPQLAEPLLARAANKRPPDSSVIGKVDSLPLELVQYNAAAMTHVTRTFYYNRGDPNVPACLTPLIFRLATKLLLEQSSTYLLSAFETRCKTQGAVPGDIAGHAIPEFPANAIAIKTAWQIIAKNGTLKLQTWDMVRRVPADLVTINAVGASAEGGRACGDMPSSDPIPLDCLYHFRLGSLAGEIKHNTKRDVKPDDFAVLLGMHIATKELPDWTWATYWFDNHSVSSPFAAQRTPEVTGVWSNYVMNATFSMLTPKSADGSLNVCFNPYLEGFDENGPRSNCLRCHRLAAQQVDAPEDGNIAPPRSAGDAYFVHALKTDYLWSVARRPDDADALLLKMLESLHLLQNQ